MGVSYDLSGRRILVVGASSGVGREVAQAASRAGARVAFAARRRDRLEQAAARAEGACVVLCDVSDEAACRRAVAEARDALGGLDSVVYAAGMSPLLMLERAGHEDWTHVLESNLIGAHHVTAAALPLVREAEGRFVYVSSYSVRQSLPGLALYRVSKVALDALIECWRMEHPDVDFTRVVLGNTANTEFAGAWKPEAMKEALDVWVERNLFPAATMMPLDVCAEAILSVLAVRGFVDDIAVMPRTRDPKAGGV